MVATKAALMDESMVGLMVSHSVATKAALMDESTVVLRVFCSAGLKAALMEIWMADLMVASKVD